MSTSTRQAWQFIPFRFFLLLSICSASITAYMDCLGTWITDDTRNECIPILDTPDNKLRGMSVLETHSGPGVMRKQACWEVRSRNSAGFEFMPNILRQGGKRRGSGGAVGRKAESSSIKKQGWVGPDGVEWGMLEQMWPPPPIPPPKGVLERCVACNISKGVDTVASLPVGTDQAIRISKGEYPFLSFAKMAQTGSVFLPKLSTRCRSIYAAAGEKHHDTASHWWKVRYYAPLLLVQDILLALITHVTLARDIHSSMEWSSAWMYY
ncbi:hypothetical protein BX600DRAFT_494415 [Xylariales sp. PMI_506]|nr:hypothetical protein BX600DRAFT_494415 [Xylariales sp. PMI_506]